MKVTLDINVLLDVFQRREPHYAASAKVVSLITGRYGAVGAWGMINSERELLAVGKSAGCPTSCTKTITIMSIVRMTLAWTRRRHRWRPCARSSPALKPKSNASSTVFGALKNFSPRSKICGKLNSKQ